MSNQPKSSVSGKKAASTAPTQNKTPRRTAGSSSPDAKPASSPAAGTGTAQPARGTSAGGIEHKYLQQLPPEESFADGAHGVTMTRNVFKLDLYRVVRYDQASNEELRNISHRIVLPMTAVPELVNLLQGVVQAMQGTANQQQARSGEPESKEDKASTRRNHEALIRQGNRPESEAERCRSLKA